MQQLVTQGILEMYFRQFCYAFTESIFEPEQIFTRTTDDRAKVS